MYPLSISSPQGKTSSVKSDSSSGSDHTRYAPFSSSIHRVHLPLIFAFFLFLPYSSPDIYLFPSFPLFVLPCFQNGGDRVVLSYASDNAFTFDPSHSPLSFHPSSSHLFPIPPSSLVASYLREKGTIWCDKDTFILDCTSNDQGGEGEETRVSLFVPLQVTINSFGASILSLSTQSISTISCPFSRLFSIHSVRLRILR